jgi:hypothetical protein
MANYEYNLIIDMRTPKPTFWITNTCSRNVSLADLDLTIKAYTSVNLLDTKHYNFTLEQLQKSLASGSIFNKRNRIVLRNIPPEIIKDSMPISRDSIIPSRERSILSIKQEEYDELRVSDEEYAKENAELIDPEPPTINKKV